MDNRLFPIKTATACLNKWTWSSLWLAQGTTANCHRVKPHAISVEDFQNFNNTPEKIAQRETMLRGEWPTQVEGCDYCQKIEAAGGKSDRQMHLDIPWVPPELHDDPTATHVTPRLVEVFINNTCNLKCIYCSPGLSSGVAKENDQFGEFRDPRPGHDHLIIWKAELELVDTRTDYVDAFFTWLENNHQHLYRLHLLGGEPFLQAEMNRFIEFFETHWSPDLEFNIISNLMVKERNMQNSVGRLSECVKAGRLKGLHITGSIDAWGPGAEYVRYGLNLETFENNLKYLLHNPQVNTVGLYQVLTCMTINEAPALYEKIKEWRQIRPELKYGFQFNIDWSKYFTHPKHWPASVWQPSFAKLIDEMERANDSMLVEMQGAWKSVQDAQPDPDAVELCHIYLDEMDRRRGTNWRTLFPYLVVDEVQTKCA